MIGLDTSVVLRLLTGQPPRDAGLARRRLERAVNQGEVVVVTDVALAEVYFALQYHYGVPKTQARASILAMLRSNIVRAAPDSAEIAFEGQPGAGVVDRLIHERHRTLGASTLTFDRKMGALEGATRLGAK
jgi:predicted nucleic acid-binding protein